MQIVVSDGLSAAAVHHNVPPLLSVLNDALAARGIQVGRPMLVRYGRVKLAEQIAAAVACELVVLLVGERPGGDAQAARSLSAYLVWDRQKSLAATDRPAADGHPRLNTRSFPIFTRRAAAAGGRGRDRRKDPSNPGLSGRRQSAGSTA